MQAVFLKPLEEKKLGVPVHSCGQVLLLNNLETTTITPATMSTGQKRQADSIQIVSSSGSKGLKHACSGKNYMTFLCLHLLFSFFLTMTHDVYHQVYCFTICC
jgi:hypothetical protein